MNRNEELLEFDCKVIRETADAWLVIKLEDLPDDDSLFAPPPDEKLFVWLPKSQCNKCGMTFEVPEWLATEKNWT